MYICTCVQRAERLYLIRQCGLPQNTCAHFAVVIGPALVEFESERKRDQDQPLHLALPRTKAAAAAGYARAITMQGNEKSK